MKLSEPVSAQALRERSQFSLKAPSKPEPEVKKPSEFASHASVGVCLRLLVHKPAKIDDKQYRGVEGQS